MARMDHYEYLDTSMLLAGCIDDRTSAGRALIAMSRIKDYLTAAKNQMTRIWSLLQRSRKAGPDWEAHLQAQSKPAIVLERTTTSLSTLLSRWPRWIDPFA